MVTNKGAALRYKHICSRDCSLLQPSLTSPIHFDKGWRLFPPQLCENVPLPISFYLLLDCEHCISPALQHLTQMCLCLGINNKDLPILILWGSVVTACSVVCLRKAICAFYRLQQL